MASHNKAAASKMAEEKSPLKHLTWIVVRSSRLALASLDSHTALIKTHLSSRHSAGFTVEADDNSFHGPHAVAGLLLLTQWDEQFVFVVCSQADA